MMEHEAAPWLESHRPWMLWLAQQRYGIVDPDDSQDIVQISSIKAWQRWDTWEDRGHGREGWMAAIVGNAARDWQRHRGAGQRAVQRFAPPALVDDAEEIAVLRLLVREVWVMLTVLERQLVLMAATGYTMREMGEHHGKTLGAIKSQEHRLRHRLASAA